MQILPGYTYTYILQISILSICFPKLNIWLSNDHTVCTAIYIDVSCFTFQYRSSAVLA